MSSVKNDQCTSMSCQQVQKINTGGIQVNDNTGIRSTDGRHQYFILDRDLVDSDALHASA
jgi:hypothetical protein